VKFLPLLCLLALTSAPALDQASITQARVTLQAAEQLHGVESAEAATCLNTLASYLVETDQYQEAKPLYLRTLEIREKVFGENDPRIAESLNDLAEILRATGDDLAAEESYRRLLRMRENISGTKSPEVAHCLNSLVVLLVSQHRYKDAWTFYQQALEIHERLGGTEPTLFKQLQTPGDLCSSGDLKKGTVLAHVQHALQIHEDALGPNQLEFAMCCYNLSGFCSSEGCLLTEEALLQLAYKAASDTLGAAHSFSAQIMLRLAVNHGKTGQAKQSLSEYRKTLIPLQTMLGDDHPRTEECISGILSGLLGQEGQDEERNRLKQIQLESSIRTLGKEHPRTVALAAMLQEAADKTKRVQQEVDATRSELAKLEEKHGTQDRALIPSLHKLAYILTHLKNYVEAESLLRRALAIREQFDGVKTDSYAEGLNVLGLMLRQAGRHAEAETLLRRELGLLEQEHGPNSSSIRVPLLNLGMLCAELKRFDEAEKLYLRAIEICRKVHGADHTFTKSARKDLESMRQKKRG